MTCRQLSQPPARGRIPAGCARTDGSRRFVAVRARHSWQNDWLTTYEQRWCWRWRSSTIEGCWRGRILVLTFEWQLFAVMSIGNRLTLKSDLM